MPWPHYHRQETEGTTFQICKIQGLIHRTPCDGVSSCPPSDHRVPSLSLAVMSGPPGSRAAARRGEGGQSRGKRPGCGRAGPREGSATPPPFPRRAPRVGDAAPEGAAVTSPAAILSGLRQRPPAPLRVRGPPAPSADPPWPTTAPRWRTARGSRWPSTRPAPSRPCSSRCRAGAPSRRPRASRATCYRCGATKRP